LPYSVETKSTNHRKEPVMKTLLIILLLSFTTTAFCQQYTGSNELTLDQAIRMALDSNYTTRTATNDLTVAQYQNTKAADNLLPTASASARYDFTHALTNRYRTTFTLDTSTGAGTINSLQDPNSHALSYGVGANVNIYNGGFDAANIRASEYNLDAAKYNLKWIRQEVAYNVVAAYINALRTKELVATTEKTLAEYQAQLDRTRGLYSAGSIPIGQVYQQETIVAQQQVQEIQARNNYENAKADLLYLLNVAPDSYRNYDVSLSGIDTSLSVLKAKEATVQPTSSTISALLTQREDFLAQRSSILSSEAAIGMTRAALLPRLGANVGLNGSGANGDLGRIQLFHDLSAGLSLSIPIYDAAQNRLQIEIQEIQLESSKVRLDQSEQLFRSDVAKAENNLRSSQQAVDATAVELKSAEESLRSATERLRVGAGIQVDVIIAETQVQTARTDRVNAVYNYLLATRQLEYLLGRTNY
jgi:outer membrane protein